MHIAASACCIMKPTEVLPMQRRTFAFHIALDAHLQTNAFIAGKCDLSTWMAQSVAAHDGVRRYVAGQGIRPGMLLGSKTIRFAEGAAAPAGIFRIRASPVFGGDSGMVAYECVVDEVSTGRRWAEARLACRVGGAGEAISDSQD